MATAEQKRTFWKRSREPPGTRTMPAGCGARARFRAWSTARVKTRCRSVSIRARYRAFCTRRPDTTRFSSWRSTANSTKAMIVDWQYEPIKGALLHIDLKRIAMDRKLKVEVPIVLKGEAAGVKQQGGILEQLLREVEVECLPGDIPTSIEADVSELVFGKVLRVADLPHNDKAQVPDRRESAGGARHHGEGRSGGDSGSGGGRSGAAPAEPEVIKKGKQEVEGEEGAEAAREGRKAGEEGKEVDRRSWPSSVVRSVTACCWELGNLGAWARSYGVKLIVGLGNPGIEYQFTPHNLGFLAIDRIAERVRRGSAKSAVPGADGAGGIGSETVLLAKPETFMNLSGQAVRELVESTRSRPEAT